MRLFKFIAFLVVVGGAGLLGFAYLGNLSPDQARVTIPVEIDAQ